MQRSGLITAAAVAVLATGAAGCAVQSQRGEHAALPHGAVVHGKDAAGVIGDGGGIVLHGRPQAVDPVAGAVASVSAGGTTGSDPTSVSVSSGDSGSGALPQPASLTEVRQQLSRSGISANPDHATLTPDGLAIAPVNAPPVVQEVIAAANQIARLPYIWGGGHATYEDTGYDCSGSLSFILAAAGLLNGTETSGEFMHYGDAGPGKWITIYAMNGHTFAYIAGLRFDTVALAETGSRWSDRPADDGGTFVARHPPGL